MGNNGRISRRQLKGILMAQQFKDFIPEGDINAIMRRLDADGDEEISFSDFFQGLLPYFIFGDLQPLSPTEIVDTLDPNAAQL